MQPPRPERTGIDDRRGDSRRASLARLSIRVESPAFGGQAENLSQAGVFFFSPDRVRVQVEIEEDGQRRLRSGTLVRVERMSAELTGYAIEFDRA